MKISHELAGQRFGMLLVIAVTKKKTKKGYTKAWLCKCDCGKEIITWGSDLLRDKIKSCKCERYTLSSSSMTEHGMSKSTEYRAWCAIKARCSSDPKGRYKWYYARGITISKEWDESFDTFFKDMGPRPSSKHSLDRINNKDIYRKGNGRWALPLTQQRNKTSNHIVNFCGLSLTISEWAELLSISQQGLSSRINTNKWSIEEALTTPLHSKRGIYSIPDVIKTHASYVS